MAEQDGAAPAGLQAISASLLVLADRLRSRAVASREFIRLTERAQSIAGKARIVSTSKWGVEENAAVLAKELVKFAGEVAAASVRATSESSGHAVVAGALVAQATRIRELGHRGAQRGSIRDELQPIEATLLTLRERMRGGDLVAKDADVLARRATGLAESAAKLSSGGRAVETAALEIQRSLCAFMEDAVSISVRISDAATGLSDAAASIVRGTSEALGGGLPASGLRPGQAGAIVWGR